MSLTNKKSSENFFNGFMSVLNLYPKIQLPERIERHSFDSGFLLDSDALNNDWKKIGNDLENSIREYENSSE